MVEFYVPRFGPFLGLKTVNADLCSVSESENFKNEIAVSNVPYLNYQSIFTMKPIMLFIMFVKIIIVAIFTHVTGFSALFHT